MIAYRFPHLRIGRCTIMLIVPSESFLLSTSTSRAPAVSIFSHSTTCELSLITNHPRHSLPCISSRITRTIPLQQMSSALGNAKCSFNETIGGQSPVNELEAFLPKKKENVCQHCDGTGLRLQKTLGVRTVMEPDE